MRQVGGRTPTPEQQAAIASDLSDFVVLAAAGSGKTYVLVERYLRHVVEQGIPPHRILAVTFTRKAAREMKERVVHELRARGLDQEAQQAETGPIQTLHGVCERLLRQHALVAGMDPEFEVMSETSATRLARRCIQQALVETAGTHPAVDAVVQRLANKVTSKFEGNREKLNHILAAVLTGIRSTRLASGDYEQIYATPEALYDRMEEFLKAAAIDHLAELPPLTRWDISTELHTHFKSNKVKLPGWLKPSAQGDRHCVENAFGLMRIALDAWWRMEMEMMQLQQVDFASLERRAVDLLEGQASVRQEVSRSVEVLLVDESQDLNPLQYAFLEALSPAHKMMVGDSQQSIYRFRQADVELFRQKSMRAKSQRLSRNMRSDAGILRYVDGLFTDRWPDYVPMARSSTRMEDWDDEGHEGIEYWHLSAAAEEDVARYVSELIREGTTAGNIAVLVGTVRFGAKLLRSLRALDVPARVVGGDRTFYGLLEIRDLANALRACADPSDDFSLLATLRSPFVGLSLDAILLLGKKPGVFERITQLDKVPSDDQPKLARFLEWYLPLTRYADRLAAWEAIAEVFASSDLLVNLARRPDADQRLANSRKLLQLAAKSPELGPLEFADRMREMDDLEYREGEASTAEEEAKEVQILTIHGSKGLEFDVVVLPEVQAKLTRNAKDFSFNRQTGLLTTKFGQEASSLHALASDQEKEADTQERLRLLYVAMTRAKKRLCLGRLSNPKAKTIDSVLRSVVVLPGLRHRGLPLEAERPGEQDQ